MATLTEQTEFLTVAEFAALLRVSEPTVYRRVADGTLPSVRFTEHGAIRIPASALEFPAGRAADRSSVAAVEPRADGGGDREERA
jgi:excisionase family DNA binding protein